MSTYFKSINPSGKAVVDDNLSRLICKSYGTLYDLNPTCTDSNDFAASELSEFPNITSKHHLCFAYRLTVTIPSPLVGIRLTEDDEYMHVSVMPGASDYDYIFHISLTYGYTYTDLEAFEKRIEVYGISETPEIASKYGLECYNENQKLVFSSMARYLNVKYVFTEDVEKYKSKGVDDYAHSDDVRNITIPSVNSNSIIVCNSFAAGFVVERKNVTFSLKKPATFWLMSVRMIRRVDGVTKIHILSTPPGIVDDIKTYHNFFMDVLYAMGPCRACPYTNLLVCE